MATLSRWISGKEELFQFEILMRMVPLGRCGLALIAV